MITYKELRTYYIWYLNPFMVIHKYIFLFAADAASYAASAAIT